MSLSLLLIHWLDDLRHEGSATFAWHAIQSNIGAWPYQAALAFLGAAIIVPPMHKKVMTEWERLHSKLDHIIEHHPDIPAFPKGSATPKS